METVTQTPTQTPQPEKVAGNSILDEMKNFVSSGNASKPVDTKPVEPVKPSPAKTGLTDQDFLNTGTHTKEPVLSLPGQPGQTQVTGTSKPITQVIANSGKFAVTLVHEMAVPALAVFVLAFFRKTTNREGWKVTKEDKDILVPAWEGYLASVNVNFDKPIYQLLIAIAFCYGSKFMEGTIKIEDVKKSAVPSTAAINEVPDKVTKENFSDTLEIERDLLIKAEVKRGKVSRKLAIRSLENSGAFKRLEKALRQKHNIPAGV